MDIEQIGRYEIIGKLGEGGMATVLLAKDSFMDREVAIKLLPRLFLHDPTFKERFQREAKLLAQLEHSAIVPVYDFGYHEEQPYMVNRYMRGGSLLDRISQHGALSLQDSLAIVSRVSSALSAAHKKGIVHRDLKPANILFDDSGQAFIADFGIAKLAQATSTLTGNTLVGTPAYMSPEQFSGEHQIDGRSDQYSLAIVLFEMLSGELPFKGDTTAKLMKNHLMDAPPSIRTLRADRPESVEPVIDKALQKDPANRFETIDAFQEALAAAVNGEPWVSDAPPAAPPPAAKPAEIYQTNVLPEEQVQSPPPEPPKKDVYSTNVLPPEERPIFPPEKPITPDGGSSGQRPAKPKGKGCKRALLITGLVVLGIAVVIGIVIGIIALINSRTPTYYYTYDEPTAHVESTVYVAPTTETYNPPPTETSIENPGPDLILSNGGYEISMDGGGWAPKNIVLAYDQSEVMGELYWTRVEDDPSWSCIAFELMSFPIGDSSTFVWQDLRVCADGSYYLTDTDMEYDTTVLDEGWLELVDDYLDFYMNCFDDTLYISVYNGDNYIEEWLDHPCMEWEHYWNFTVYNNTALMVDWVEAYQYYE